MPDAPILPTVLDAATFRNIGPIRGGRVIAVAGDPRNPAVYYFGAVAGGVWKTDDAGTTWRCITDGFFKTSAVGALCVADSDPNVIYAGMGETTIRTDVSHGDGVYKSTDGGRTWKHLGLADTRYIGKVRVHPKNPDLVYVAALGHAFGPNEERGVYRSRNGGVTWEKVLFKSNRAGAVDLSIDPQNPDVIYASIWQVYRNFWELNSGGEDSGLWRSLDGGDSWEEISLNQGFPQSLKGKIGVVASPVKAGRVWAMVEAKDASGLYRSDDFGQTWQKLTDNPDLLCRPWYYMHIYADPQDEDTVYVLNLGMHKSSDGGKTFVEIPTPHGDNHDLWIDPRNNRRMVQGNDGGACVSFNGGESFSTIYNQPTAQFYHMDVDDHFPYRVYGTQQDNSSICVPSDTIERRHHLGRLRGGRAQAKAAILPSSPTTRTSSTWARWAVRRADRARCSAVTGARGRFSWSTSGPRISMAEAWARPKIRFPWTFPILFSPHDANVLYACGNQAFRSTDGGHTWTRLLARPDPGRHEQAGAVGRADHPGHQRRRALRHDLHLPRVAPRAGRLLGRQRRRAGASLARQRQDAGRTSPRLTCPNGATSAPWSRRPSSRRPATWPPPATSWTTTRLICSRPATTARPGCASPTAPGGRFRPRAFAAIPMCRACSTSGRRRVSISPSTMAPTGSAGRANLPVSPIYDMRIKDADLVLATHGRGFWIGEDLSLLYQALQEHARNSQPRAPSLRSAPHAIASCPISLPTGCPPRAKIYGIGLGSGATLLAEKTADRPDQTHLPRCGRGRAFGVWWWTISWLRRRRRDAGHARLSGQRRSPDPRLWAQASRLRPVGRQAEGHGSRARGFRCRRG